MFSINYIYNVFERRVGKGKEGEREEENRHRDSDITKELPSNGPFFKCLQWLRLLWGAPGVGAKARNTALDFHAVARSQ